MLKDWFQVILYVTVAAPVPTHKDLWKPASPEGVHRLARTPAAVSSNALGSNVVIPPMAPSGVRQQLHAPMDITQAQPHSPEWVDLQKPGAVLPKEASHPSVDHKDAKAAPQKQFLHAPPKRPMSDDKSLHPYQFHMEGDLSLDGHPLPNASVILKVATPHANVTRNVTSDAHGHYNVSLSIRGGESENLLWWIHAETRDARSVEREGSRIFAVQEPDMSVTADLQLSPV